MTFRKKDYHMVYNCRVVMVDDPTNKYSGNYDLTRSIDRSYDEEVTNNILVNDGKRKEAFLTGRFCPDLHSEQMCTDCEQLEESYKELCLIDPCLVVGGGERGQCYKLLGELIKK